jgi:hypothetical protein
MRLLRDLCAPFEVKSASALPADLSGDQRSAVESAMQCAIEATKDQVREYIVQMVAVSLNELCTSLLSQERGT